MARLAILLAALLTVACGSEAEETPPVEHGDMPWARTDDPERDRSFATRDITRALAVEPGHVVADVGAGAGYFAFRLASAVGAEGRVIATEMDESMARHMERELALRGVDNLDVRRVGGERLELGEATVDRILMVNSLAFPVCREARNRTYLSEARRALRPGGRLVVFRDAVHDEDWRPPYGDPPSCAESTAEQIIEVAPSGLSLVDNDPRPLGTLPLTGTQPGYLLVFEAAD